jgi:Holliday junction resolvase RusA-like endonuclease
MTAPRRGRISGTIPGKPVAFARTGFEVITDTGKRRRINPARYTQWKTAAGYYALQHRARWRLGGPLEGPLGIDIIVAPDGVAYEVFELATNERPKGIRGDLDNYVKATLDALTGVAFADDAQIHFITAHLSTDLEDPSA